MRGALILAAALLLTGCDQSEAADGYAFEAATISRDRPNIRIVPHRSLAELRAAAPKGIYDADKAKLMAWSIIRPDECEMHIVEPAASYQPEWIGHELVHCIRGEWHR